MVRKLLQATQTSENVLSTSGLAILNERKESHSQGSMQIRHFESESILWRMWRHSPPPGASSSWGGEGDFAKFKAGKEVGESEQTLAENSVDTLRKGITGHDAGQINLAMMLRTQQHLTYRVQ
jgi:hypothetical protein